MADYPVVTSTIFEDTFTGTPNAYLEVYDPSWKMLNTRGSNNYIRITDVGRIRGHYHRQRAYREEVLAGEYVVSADVYTASEYKYSSAGILFGVNPTTTEYYLFSIDNVDPIDRTIGMVQLVIGSGDSTIRESINITNISAPTNSTHRLAVHVKGTNQAEFFIDGVHVYTLADSTPITIDANSKAGVNVHSYGASSNTRSYHLDNFKIEAVADGGGGDPGPVTPTIDSLTHVNPSPMFYLI